MVTLGALARSPVVVESGSAFHDLYPRLLETVLERGHKVAPRGEPTYEISPLVFVLEDPRDCIRLQRCRRLNYAYAVVEKLSLLRDVVDVEMFCFYIPRLRCLLSEQGTFEGAYGPRVSAQLGYVYDLLRQDPDSRRAVITVFSSPADHKPSPDIPCTISLQFLLRDGQLSLIANMRSSDIYLGLPYDVQQFTFLQQLLAGWLDVGLGPYIHVAGSAHIYERDLSRVLEVLRHPDELNAHAEPPVDLPYQEVWRQTDAFFQAERELRTRQAKLPHDAFTSHKLSDYLRCSLDTVSRFIRRRSAAPFALS